MLAFIIILAVFASTFQQNVLYTPSDGKSVDNRPASEVLDDIRSKYQNVRPLASQGNIAIVFEAESKDGNRERLIIKSLVNEAEMRLSIYVRGQPGFVNVRHAFGMNLIYFMSTMCPEECAEMIAKYGKKRIPPTVQFMVLERVEGPTLYSVLGETHATKGPVLMKEWFKPPQFVLSVLLQIISLMNFAANELNFFHLDAHVKNILFDKPIDQEACVQSREMDTEWALKFGQSQQLSVPASWTCGSKVLMIDYHGAFVPGRFGYRRHDSYQDGVTRALRYAIMSLVVTLPCELTSQWKDMLRGEPGETKEVLRAIEAILATTFAVSRHSNNILYGSYNLCRDPLFHQLCRKVDRNNKEWTDNVEKYVTPFADDDGTTTSEYHTFWQIAQNAKLRLERISQNDFHEPELAPVDVRVPENSATV